MFRERGVGSGLELLAQCGLLVWHRCSWPTTGTAGSYLSGVASQAQPALDAAQAYPKCCGDFLAAHSLVECCHDAFAQIV